MSIFEIRPVTFAGKTLTEEEVKEISRQYEARWRAQIIINFTGIDEDLAIRIGGDAAANLYGDSTAEAIVDAMWYYVDEGELDREVIDKFVEEWRKDGAWR